MYKLLSESLLGIFSKLDEESITFMYSIEIEPTYKSPRVFFNAANGKLLIEGKSILVNVEEFYKPLLDWFDKFIEQTQLKTIELTFDIEYYNLASTKRFLFFLAKLKSFQEQGNQVIVNWAYSSNDSNALELGQDLSQMIKLDFNFVAYEKLKEKTTL